MTGTYAAGEGVGEEAPKAFVSVNWVLSEEPMDVETELALGFLDYLLLGTSAAPLSKALNDSGLGESQIGGGLMDDLRQPVFSLGLKGVDPKDSKKVYTDFNHNEMNIVVIGFRPNLLTSAWQKNSSIKSRQSCLL